MISQLIIKLKNMSKNKKSLNTVIALSAIIITFSVTTYANASFGYFGLNEEQRNAMERAVEDGDYNAWKNIQDSNTKIADIINKNNFAEFSEMHNLIQSGKLSEADVIRGELGLPNKANRMRVDNSRRRRGRGAGNISDFLTVKEALDNGDYNNWKEAVGDAKISEVIQNENDFQKLIESHNLILDGKFKEAKEINNDLGVASFGGKNFGKHRKVVDAKWFGKIN